MTKLWQVQRVTWTPEGLKHGPHVPYPFRVEGVYLPACGHRIGETFSWVVPDIDSPQYDLSAIEFAEDGVPLLAPARGEGRGE